MIEKLRSHLRKSKGFTLIELLIVIAIIAILVVIVIVAINPVQRLNDARDRTAASNVRATGTLVATCVTRALSQATAGTLADCDTNGEVATTGEGNIPANVHVVANVGGTNICAGQQGSAAHWYRYEHLTGTTAEVAGTMSDPLAAADCP